MGPAIKKHKNAVEIGLQSCAYHKTRLIWDRFWGEPKMFCHITIKKQFLEDTKQCISS